MATTISIPGNLESKTGVPLTQDIRDMFDAAKVDVNALQARATALETTTTGQQTGAGPRCVRGVCTTNMSTSAFVGVSGGTPQDGVTYAAGDRVLLAGQSTAAQNGIYVVGTVAAGTAPLTRATDFAAAASIVNGSVVEVSEGTIFAGTSWKAMCTGAAVVGTNDPLFYPKSVTVAATLVAGTIAITSLPIYSATKSNYTIVRKTANTCAATDGGYHPLSITAGKVGTATVSITACVLAGTINNADVSTLIVTLHNF